MPHKLYNLLTCEYGLQVLSTNTNYSKANGHCLVMLRYTNEFVSVYCSQEYVRLLVFATSSVKLTAFCDSTWRTIPEGCHLLLSGIVLNEQLIVLDYIQD
jgi:hypothetical protein